MFKRYVIVFFALLFFSLPAAAQQQIAVVDFQKALDQVKDGDTARAKLDAKMKEKQQAIANMETRLRTMQEDYEKQALILSDAARKQKEQEMMNAQMEYQQAYMASEGEMQQMYMELMEGLIAKMRTIAAEIGKERGYDLILEAQAVVYWSDKHDITAELIKRYNNAHP